MNLLGLGIVNCLIVAWLLTFIGVDYIVINSFEELFDKELSIHTYYFFFFSVGFVRDIYSYFKFHKK